MSPIVVVAGPSEAGPGEREQMLDAADAVLAGVADPVRIDVPGRGGSVPDGGDGVLRPEVAPIVPALQSGSLFDTGSGVMVVDAQQLLKAEAEVITELIEAVDREAVTAVFVAAGTIPAPLGKALQRSGDKVKIEKLRERDVGPWIAKAARARGVTVHGDAVGMLVQRFGTDIAAIGRALDQLAADGVEVTADEVRNRFLNRPDEPMWFLADAISDGDVGTALRRLSDYLVHGHPLALLAFLEGELRKRSLAGVAPDVETYADWVGAGPKTYPVTKAWRVRHAASPDALRAALGAIARADTRLKSEAEATYRVTLERLVVALCRWYGGTRIRR